MTIWLDSSEEPDADEELRLLKEQMLGNTPVQSTKQVTSSSDNTAIINELQKALEQTLQELRQAISVNAGIQKDLQQQCHQSKLKAVESHEKAQASLSSHDMTAVFEHSIEKATRIKVVQALREQADQVESKTNALRKHLTKLEQLKTKFKKQAQLINLQVAKPNADAAVESLKQQLGLEQATQKNSSVVHLQSKSQLLEDAAVDAELIGLKRQLDQL